MASKFGHNPVYSESAEGLKNIKAICVGNGGVGKSNVVRHILGVGYLADYQPTFGVQFIKKDLQDNVRLQVWDMPGDDRFMKIAASYFKGAHLFIIVFDVNNRGSYEAIPHIEKYIEAPTSREIAEHYQADQRTSGGIRSCGAELQSSKGSSWAVRAQEFSEENV